MAENILDILRVRPCNYYQLLFGPCIPRKLFFLPQYQRPFAWEEKQIEDFWSDIVFAFEETPDLPYLLGSVYLAKLSLEDLAHHVNPEVLAASSKQIQNDGEFYLIIDGQQRAVTYFLFLIAFGETTGLFASDRPVLNLGNSDHAFFCDFSTSDPSTRDKMQAKSRSNERIRKAFDLFQKNSEAFDRSDEIKQFVMKKLQVVEILIERNIELATTLFVSQTDRGKRLTNLEKLKSTLMFYGGKVDSENLSRTGIDNLFVRFFEDIERLCSKDMRIYRRADSAEADVLRVLNFFLLKDGFYSTYYNDLVENNTEKIEIWYETGEDRIYEAINKIFRMCLLRNNKGKESVKKVIDVLVYHLKRIASYYSYLVRSAIPGEKNNEFIDQYEGKTWFPMKQLYNLLGLFVYSKALLVELHDRPDVLTPSFKIEKDPSVQEFDPLERIERIKLKYDKLLFLKAGNNPPGDIALIRQSPSALSFLTRKLDEGLDRIRSRFAEFSKKPLSIYSLIEECELGTWKAGKRPLGTFVWGGSEKDEIIRHICGCSRWYKNEYLVRDLSYENYKYILYEYERLLYPHTSEEIHHIMNLDIDEDDGILIQREHIFPQNPGNYDELQGLWRSVMNEGYDEWIWMIGNITLLEHTINIGNAGNKPIWEKAAIYLDKDTAFKSTRSVAKDILALKLILDSSSEIHNDSSLGWMTYKLFFEIRDLELLCFTHYRFS